MQSAVTAIRPDLLTEKVRQQHLYALKREESEACSVEVEVSFSSHTLSLPFSAPNTGGAG